MNDTPKINLEWKSSGANKGSERGDIVIIVDTLSFATTVAVATCRGAMIYPCWPSDDPVALGRSLDAEVAVRRTEGEGPTGFSLSPGSFSKIEPGTRVILPSPNGATCCRAADKGPFVFVGTLVNAAATATAVSNLSKRDGLSITVVACGEREEYGLESGEIRFALEDYLGAGVIISGLNFEKSPEALVCEKAYSACRDELNEIIRNCQSGQELLDRGYGDDVRIASDIDSRDSAVWYKDGWLVKYQI